MPANMWLTKLMNFSHGVSPGTSGNFIFAFGILSLVVVWTRVVRVVFASQFFVREPPSERGPRSFHKPATICQRRTLPFCSATLMSGLFDTMSAGDNN
jgi:hypothetical protein